MSTRIPATERASMPAFSSQASPSFGLAELRPTNPSKFVNFRLTWTTRRNRQLFFDWRAEQKSSQRAGSAIIVIKDSSGLIGGRLEPQRGRPLTAKAVCGGTLGWKDPPFNSILALPGATHQDPTQNEIINEIINYILKYYPLDRCLNKDIINNTKTTLSVCLKNDNELISNYLSQTKIAAGQQSELCCHFLRKNKMCRHKSDSRCNAEKYGYKAKYIWIILKLGCHFCHHVNDSYQLPDKYLINYLNCSYQLLGKYVINDKYLNDNYQMHDNYVHYARTKWQSDKNIEKGYKDKSYLFPKYVNYVRINWHRNKVCRHLADSWCWLDNKAIMPDKYSKLGGNYWFPKQVEFRIKWHEIKMCPLTDDSCHSLRKNHKVKGYYTADSKALKVTLTIETASSRKKDSIASIKLAYIHPTKDSYKLPGNCGNYEQYTRINWTKYTSKYERIKWLKNKMCHLTDDSCCPPSKYIILLIDYKAYYTDNNRSIRIAMVLETEVFQIRDSIGTIVDRPHDCMKLSACFHAACFQVYEQAAFGVGSSAALTHITRLTNLLYLLVNFCGNDSYHTVENIKPKDKMCHETNDSYHPLKNPLKKRIVIILNSMCYVGNDSFYIVETRPIKTTVTVQKKDSITPMSELTSIPAFHPRKQAVKPAASTALKERSINLLYLLVNIYQTTEKNRQSFFDWRTKQKPSRRAGLVTAIKDSPGLIGGRLEPLWGQSLNVKAVRGGTLGWKDPPFNSILALPGATDQDPTKNKIINDLNSLKIKYIISQNNLKLVEKIIYNIKLSITLACLSIANRIFKLNTTLIHLLYSQSTRTGQIVCNPKIRCQKNARQIVLLKSKMCLWGIEPMSDMLECCKANLNPLRQHKTLNNKDFYTRERGRQTKSFGIQIQNGIKISNIISQNNLKLKEKIIYHKK